MGFRERQGCFLPDILFVTEKEYFKPFVFPKYSGRSLSSPGTTPSGIFFRPRQKDMNKG
jgi:hypothetical protein